VLISALHRVRCTTSKIIDGIIFLGAQGRQGGDETSYGWPMPQDKLTNPEFWRFRAEEARSIADNMHHEQPKAVMLRIAEDYERIAKFFEQQARGKK